LKITDYKNIIWDWNGTLLDDVWLCADIMNNLLKRRSLPGITLERYKEIFTFPVKEYYISAGHNFEKESFEIIGKEFMDEYETRKGDCKLFPHTKRALNKLEELKINQYLLSAYKQESLISLVDMYNLSNYFKIIRGLNHIYADGKIEIGKKLMSEISADGRQSSTLFIGDTLHDLEVADSLGADCLLITSGHQSASKLASDCTDTLPTMNHLYSLINGSKLE